MKFFFCCLLGLSTYTASLESITSNDLKSALTLHASFDKGVEADLAKGDATLFHVEKIDKLEPVKIGLPDNKGIVLESESGWIGSALRFNARLDEVIYYQAKDNINYTNSKWSGAISVWLKLSPNEDLAPGFSDPIQITPRTWNDACLFVDFSRDERPRHFRMGIFEDIKKWNPENIGWEKIKNQSDYMVTVTEPPFNRDKWTHVLINFTGLNDETHPGKASLYLDGELKGSTQKTQQFTWDIEATRIMLGIYYTGWLDEFSIFNRALTQEEIVQLGTKEFVRTFPR